MPDTTQAVTLNVQRRDSDDIVSDIGKVSFGDRGKLTLLSADPAFQSALENIINAVNAQEELRIKVPPPPESEPGALYRRNAKREDDDILDVMREYMEQKYDLLLTP